MLDPQEGIATESLDFAALKASIRQQLQPFHEDSAATFEETDLASSESDVEQVRPGDPVFGSSLLAPKTSLESSLFIKNAIHKLKALDESLFAGLDAVSSIHNLMALCIGLTQLDTRSDASISAIIEKAVLKWLQRVCALPELKHVHFHGSTDFSAGILPAQEIQVYRTATFLCMGPNPDRITSASIPVFYFPSTLTESDPSHPEKLIKKYWALIGTPSHSPTAKIRRIPSTGPSTETLDVSLLIAYLSEDVAVGRRPCVVYCRALSSSASLLGEWDDLGKIREACSRFGAWMHVECDNMSLLTAPSMTDDADTRRKLESLRVADSITFHASEAFKLERAADLPSITLFNTVDPRLVDPLHMEAFDTLLEKPTALQAASQRRRSSGSAGGALIASVLRTTGSSGGERMSSEYQFPDFGGSSGGIGMSRSGSVSSVASNGGVVRAVSPNSSRLLKRMSSNALFHAACFSGENSEALIPVGLKYSLPWWLWSMGTWTGELMDSFQLGQELTEKLADRLERVSRSQCFLQPSFNQLLDRFVSFQSHSFSKRYSFDTSLCPLFMFLMYQRSHNPLSQNHRKCQ
ncbi:hypothetical protein BDR26DRAFT_557791 [Obelidium mucronatum]|nr:hypothetical protein BDR26DRAFT_557791 [Obelidium mucronatum]